MMTSFDVESSALAIPPSMQIGKWGITVAYVGICLYVWLLPILADVFDYNSKTEFCNSVITCTDDTKFTDVVGPTGCGCGQGVFGQSACPVGAYGYTISSFIATAPATGVTACVSALPLMAIWYVGTGSSRIHKRDEVSRLIRSIIWWSMVGFQIAYATFLGGTYCIYPNLHEIAVICFVMFGVIHYALIAYVHIVYFEDKVEGSLIILMSSITVTGFFGLAISGYLFNNENLYSVKYMPWMFECIAYTAGFSLSPIMAWYA